MSRIVLLDELTANKIAAGEVVERPASVVKELIENSIDAGSSLIEIAVTDGGLTSIIVSDNGIGMDDVDAKLAFERHATSKIHDASDLDRISTLGFRGEAMPSIASISKLTLKTKLKESLSGTEIRIEGGKLLEFNETGCPNGTIIKVEDLFYNTPARKKHAKSPTVEAGHISNIVNRFAMGYPCISFQLKNNDRVVLKTSGNGSLLDCIVSIYGIETAREMLPINVESEDSGLSGYIGKPSLTRSGRNHQTIYINGRFVKSKLVSEAIERAYHSMLMIGRHPLFVINVTVNPEDVDVNVHPAKTEVRLSRTRQLETFITDSVSKALSGSRLIPSSENASVCLSRRKEDVVQESFKISYSQTSKSDKIFEVPIQKRYVIDSVNQLPVHIENESDAPQEGGQPEANGYDNSDEFPDLRPLGQIDSTYIIAQGPDGMYVIDQHAAHERILYEKFMYRPEEFTTTEQLLFPVTVQLTHQEAQLLNDKIIALTDLGFVIEHFGGESFLLRGVPAGIAKDGGKQIFLDLLDYFSQNRYTITSKALKEKLLITMACKGAIKANQRLGLPEMEALVADLSLTRHPYTCPHGRPTLISFSGYDLEKKFKRVL